LVINLTDHLDAVCIPPNSLRRNEVDAVLDQVRRALGRIKPKLKRV